MIDAAELLRLRTVAGYSQRSLAKLVGVSGNAIMRIERGADTSRITLAELDRMARALGVQPGQLLLGNAGPEVLCPARGAGGIDTEDLDHNAAKLLRRIHRGDEVRRNMTRADREITLPALVKRGLIEITPSGPVPTSPVVVSLSPACADTDLTRVRP